MSRRVDGIVVRGHRVASGLAADTPYKAGTIELQIPHFARLGVDLSEYHPATVNVDIRPYHFRIGSTATCLRYVKWADEHPPESFSFSPCRLVYHETEYEAMIYYPHPETKKKHHQSDETLEIIAPLIPGLKYGSKVAVVVGNEVTFH